MSCTLAKQSVLRNMNYISREFPKFICQVNCSVAFVEGCHCFLNECSHCIGSNYRQSGALDLVSQPVQILPCQLDHLGFTLYSG